MPVSQEINIKSAVFIKSAPNVQQCPQTDLPEFAFIGRSNVGKSSLINLICNNKNLAKVSKTPGKTKLINYFLIDKSWHLVDLPGYGYAKTAKSNRSLWLETTVQYFLERKNLQIVFVLIDGSIPAQGNDLDFINWLIEVKLTFALVFTKTDKVSQKILHTNIQFYLDYISDMGIASFPYFQTSVSKKHSKDKLLEHIYNQITPIVD